MTSTSEAIDPEFDEWLSGYADIRLVKWGRSKAFLEIVLHSKDAERIRDRLGIVAPLMTSSAGYDYPSFKVGFFRHIPEAEKTFPNSGLKALRKKVEKEKEWYIHRIDTASDYEAPIMQAVINKLNFVLSEIDSLIEEKRE